MKNLLKTIVFLLFAIGVFTAFKKGQPAADSILFRHVTLIDGNGKSPVANTDILIQGETIADIGKNLQAPGARIIDLKGKTVMPSLICAHMHIGLLKGTANNAENYTRDNILSQLNKYESYGVGNVLVMGTDRPILFESGLRDSSENGLLPGARLHSAGYGFGVPENAPPIEVGTDKVFRPQSKENVPLEMDTNAKLHPTIIKMWVDDFAGKYKKMDPSIYKSIITEAHKRNIRVASHLFYLADARKLVASGLDVIAHSIRDSVVDDALVQEMKKRNVMYIPTLSLDEFSYIYARKPEWINDEFFKRSLEPGVYEMITSEKYQNDLKNSPQYARNVKSFETALKNLQKIYAAGILVALGTDSGATPIRTQGFSEHLELELMVQAGLTPLQAITVATKNAAKLLKIDDHFGTLQKGKTADFIILSADPTKDIKNSRRIESVYKSGKEVSHGPLNN
ncbi:MAG: amidohydrolase family protein [Flavitalea sp.]